MNMMMKKQKFNESSISYLNSRKNEVNLYHSIQAKLILKKKPMNVNMIDVIFIKILIFLNFTSN